MQFGWTADEAASFAVLDAFVESGGNFVDTADIYSRWHQGNSGGEAEEVIGRWIRARGNRNGLVIATKVRGEMWKGTDGEGLTRSHIVRAVDDSLRRLGLETIDLYQGHWPDANVPIEDTLETFEELIKAGKVRHAGLSNYDSAELSAALAAGTSPDRAKVVALQPHYNLVHRSEFEGALADICRTQRLAVIPYSPLAAGFLTGKYRRASRQRGPRAAAATKYAGDRGYGVLDAVGSIAQVRNTTMPAVALAWLLANPTVTAPIIGANSVDQLRDLLPSVGLNLTTDELDMLNAASVGS
jgi:aryl-alcohol dehydrogenase-like predicted oxidoreductase